MAIQDVSIRDRIIASADGLYEKAGREKFPSVDAVRRESRADMNSVSLVMKEWRHSKTVQVVPVRAVAVPEAIQTANAAAVADIWIMATELANQSLQAAQAGWDAERFELEEMRSELAVSYEKVAETETQAQERIKFLTDELEKLREDFSELGLSTAKEFAELKDEIIQANSAAHTEKTRSIELELRVEDLKTSLAQVAVQVQDEKQKLAEKTTQFEVELANKTRHFESEKAKQAAHFESVTTTKNARLEVALAEIATLKSAAGFAAEQQIKSTGDIQRLLSELSLERDKTAVARERAERLEGGRESMQQQISELLAVISQKKEEKQV